ncbi:MAG: aminotransferase class I/II-fold pyridoxal phosphate-dependent enzyme [Planctomycetes bacterium]|nr:aminotransferase class I/II-fold pyridoxal phosphate-dependent enzyme [Planctomycetota bacterium]
MKINLSRPDINEADIEAVCEVLRTPNLALGPKMAEFEKKIADYVGRKYAVAVNSGTSALFLCMKALGIGPGDEVITTPFTFIASVNCILMVGAKPVFVDIEPRNLNIDPAGIEKKITDRTKAILPVVVFGNPAGLDEVCRIAQKHNLPVIEDSCEGIGSELKGKKVGSFGTMSTFAFYPNKQMTTGEGGMIVTDDEELAQMCISLRNQGRGAGGGWLAHERMGYNFRLSDINCALGITQLGRLEEFIEKRRQVAEWYQEKLAPDSRLIVPAAPADCRMSWFVFVVRLIDEYAQKRNGILKAMRDAGIGVSNYFPPVTLQPFMVEQFGYKDGDFPVTGSVCKSTIALPFYNNLRKDEVGIVCDTLQKYLDNSN